MTRPMLIALLLAALPATATANPLGCLILPRQEADIGTPVAGVVESVEVERGDRVQQGQVLVVLQSQVEAAGAELSRERARVAATVRAAEASLALAESRYRRSVGLHEQKFISAQALEQASAEREVSRQQLEQAREQLRVLGRERSLAEAQLGQRLLRAPFDGVVVDRSVEPGERVEHNALMRLAAIDELRVELVMPASAFGSIRIGDRLEVQPDLPGYPAVSALTTIVDPAIDAASNTFRVRLLIDNRSAGIPPGARCRLATAGTAAGGSGTAARN